MAGERSRQVSLAVLLVLGAWALVYWFWKPGGQELEFESDPLTLASTPQSPPETERNQTPVRQPTGTPDPDPGNPTGPPASEPQESPEPDDPAPSGAEQPRVYTVQRGDSLSRIAQREYGSVRYTDLIYNANRDVLSAPDALQPGMRLVLPAADE